MSASTEAPVASMVVIVSLLPVQAGSLHLATFRSRPVALWYEITGLASAPIVTDESCPTTPVASTVEAPLIRRP